MLEAVVFDLDGTLWDSAEPVAAAWNTVLKKYKNISLRLTAEDIHGYMGKTIDVIAGLVFPELPESESMAIVLECSRAENDWLSQRGGVLYEGLVEVLTELKQSCRLFIVSNCQEGYIEAFLTYHRLGNYFEDYEMYGRTGRVKGENIKAVLLRHGISSKNAVYVGDTQSDLEAANLAGVGFIHAAYGFGSVNRETAHIKSIKELPAVLENC
jgi:phosphoglycolate phosphatase